MDFLDTNHWVPVHTLEGFQSCIEYFISRDGEVLSTKGNKERILKTCINTDGYEMVHLRKRLGQRGEITVAVHKLVAYAFLPPPPTPHGRGKGCSLIDHDDHNRSNNCVDNLLWNTGSGNCDNRIDFSSTPIGQTEEYQQKKDYNKRLMAEKRLDPEFRAKECSEQQERYRKLRADPVAWRAYLDKKAEWKEENKEREAEWMRKTLEKRAADPERTAKLKAYKKRHREGVKADPEKAKKQREYQREYMKKRRARIKAEKKANEDNTIQ